MAHIGFDTFVEAQRLAALHSFAVTDAAAHPAFERIVHIASRMLRAELASVSFVDADRSWHAAIIGSAVREMDRSHAFCSVTIQQSDVLVIPDAALDRRFANNPLVSGEKVRFYAGAPIITKDGARIGTVCVMDRTPRPGLTDDEYDTLIDLASTVACILQGHQQARLEGLSPNQAQTVKALTRIASSKKSEEAIDGMLADGIVLFGAHSARLWRATGERGLIELACCVHEGDLPHPAPLPAPPDCFVDRVIASGSMQAVCVNELTAQDEPLWAILLAEGSNCALVQPTIIGERRFAIVMTFKGACEQLPQIAADFDALLSSLAPALHYKAIHARQPSFVAGSGAPLIEASVRQAAERDARELDASFRLMFQDNPLPMLLYDAATLRIVEANDAATHAYGYERKAFVKLKLLDLIPEEDRDEARAFLDQAGDGPSSSTLSHVMATGDRIRVQIVTQALSLAGRPTRIAVAWDVTEVEDARDALRHSNKELVLLAGELQARTADLIEINRRARLGMWRMSPDGGQSDWSDEMFEIFGRPPTRPGPDSSTVMSWIAPGDRTRVREIVMRVIEWRALQSFEFRVIRPNGTVRHCLADLAPDVDFSGTLIALKGFCQDITERKETELALLRSEKLKTIGQFTGGVAHDFNNLLTVIMLNVEEAIETLPFDDPMQTLLGPVLHAAVRGAELTSQLLSYARRSPLEPMHVSLHDLFNGLNPLLDRILGDRFELEVQHGEGPVEPFVDAAKLENAVLNLVINARDAMSNGGRITISTAFATLGPRDVPSGTELAPGNYAVISVADTGCGIPADLFPRVFEPFFTTKTAGKGSGLGLSMVYGFAKQSGGHFALKSEENIGTTATLYLPLHLDHDGPTLRSAKRAVKAVAPRMVALLVEDQQEVLETVRRQLLALGFNVIVATDAARAMNHITANSMLDLLFSDVAIPGPVDGTQLAAIARERHPEIRILLTSGYMDHTGPRSTDIAPGTEFLQKPYSRADLAERLAAMFPLAEPIPASAL